MLRTNFWIGLANPVDRPYEAITAKTTAPRVMAMALLLAKMKRAREHRLYKLPPSTL